MKPATGWQKRLDRWLEPFLDALGDKRRRVWAPLYILGLLLPGDRKSMQPISFRVAPKDVEQIQHFVSTSCWDPEPVEEVLCQKVDEMLGGESSFLIVDDTSLPKKGSKSVGVAHQYCGALGKQANCQCLVSLTLAKDDLPAPLALRLYLPQTWTKDLERCKRAKVPPEIVYRPKWKIALDEIDRVRAAGVRFGCVLADAGYGMCAEFRQGLTARSLAWAVGILSTQNMYPADVKVWMPAGGKRVGRPRVHPKVDAAPYSAERFIEQYGRFRQVTWREGTKGKLSGDFAIVRVRPADGDEAKDGVHLPGDPAWLVCERLENGDKKFSLVNLPASESDKQIVGALKARWACEQGHQQMKEELGLDHFEGRSWFGLHHHAVLTMIAFAFLQHLRLIENKSAA
ncbi:MAG TPA: IS701 family transposase [Polyangiaceae bacterium]|jgi:SRSO17 transposase|nr:IS701 family transposase [Polyangiaceae bacterium]